VTRASSASAAELRIIPRIPDWGLQSLLKISPLSKPPTIPGTMATGLYNNLSTAASLHLVIAQLAMSAPTANASLAPDRRWALDRQVS
jgi:hypothetical protein